MVSAKEVQTVRLITNKARAKIGKRLAAILYIATYGYGKGVKNDLDATTYIIEHVYEIAYAVGGFKFSAFEVPALLDNLKRCAGDERKGGDE